MSQPTIELGYFTATQTLLDNPSVLHSGYDCVSGEGGPHRIYEAVDVEDDKKRWIVVVWDSYEHHMRSTEGPGYPEAAKKLATCVDGEFRSHHVIFSDDTMVALNAPITEFGLLKLKDLSTKDEFLRVMGELIEHSRKVSGEIRELRHQPFIFGETREEPGLFYFVAGWESVEEHVNSSNNPAGNLRFVGEIGRLVDITISHTRVKEYNLHKERV